MGIPNEASIGEVYGPAMEITTEEAAQEYLEALIERYLRLFPEDTHEQALACELSNLGYYAGYYDDMTRFRVQRLYGATHPIFGGTRPSTDEALQAGIDAANDNA